MNPSVPSPAPIGAASRFPSGAPAGAHVVVRGLRKEFLHGGRRLIVLDGIDFEIRPGEIVSVIGASGAGK
jgi:sulfonate transport system ATP-binding protein